LKIILLDCQNNYVSNSSISNNRAMLQKVLTF